MNIIAVDDEISALNILCRAVGDAVPKAVLHSYQHPSEVMPELIRDGFIPDVAFIDIEMPGIGGLELARILKMTYLKINIIFVTGFSQYALEAMELRPSGYIMKPATREKVLIELENLRNPPKRTVPSKRIKIQCFGSFEIFVDEKPVKFNRAKSKEMLAYLVDRHGAGCTSSEIAEVIWEDGLYDRSRQKQLSVIRLDLIKSLDKAGIGNIVFKSRELISVDPSKFDCDYYMALEGDMVMVNSFMGEYMMPYIWGEVTNALLTAKFIK